MDAFAQRFLLLGQKFNSHLHVLNNIKPTFIVYINHYKRYRNNFGHLCFLVRKLGGSVDHKEHVSMFLSILAHHKKNQVVKFDYQMSGHTISHYVHLVLKVVLKLHTLFLVEPIHVPNDSTDSRWKQFKVNKTTILLQYSFMIPHYPHCYFFHGMALYGHWMGTTICVTMNMQIARAFLSHTEGLGITINSGDHLPKDLSTTNSTSI
ncbi:hypothetical protein ACS0TY_026328 [Phlomoides rotata]